jgi:hypothetical protein
MRKVQVPSQEKQEKARASLTPHQGESFEHSKKKDEEEY